MTLEELRALVAENLGQPLEENSRLTMARVDRAVNEGYVRFAADARCFRRTVSVPVQGGVATLPPDVIEPLQAWWGTQHLAPTTAELLDLDDPDWRIRPAGDPTQWLRADATTLQVTPAAEGELLLLGEVTPSDVPGGIPLLLPGASPALPYAVQSAPALWATWQLAAYLFPDDPVAAASGQVALAQYGECVTQLRGAMAGKGAYR